ncbi:MAG: FtsW/RodA/SpoVE family cell cycle protein [Bacteroidales bacterium]|nr:FtsW/RodA/SpoVE family cell cycle protein [Bacteroidales bacterium]
MGNTLNKAEQKFKNLAGKLKGDKVIWLIIACFAMISLLVVYSSTSALAYRYDESPFGYMAEQFLFYLIGFIILLICYRINLGVYRKLTYLIFGGSMALLIVPILTGGMRSFSLGPVDVQPSEIAKITVVLYLARILEVYKLDTFKEYFLKIVIPIGAMLLLCLMGSASVTIIITIVVAIILLSSKINKKFILYTIPIALAVFAGVVVINKTTGMFSRIETVEARVERFFSGDNEENMSYEELMKKKEKEFQGEKAIDAIQLGGFTGRGPGNSFVRDTLPNAYDDYIFSIIVEEYGLIGGIIVILLYLWFIVRCIIIAQSCNKTFSVITVMGLCTLIAIQAFLHIMVNVGLLPVTGQTLPMISKGGSALVVMSVAFGIILSINRTIEVSNTEKTNG